MVAEEAGSDVRSGSGHGERVDVIGQAAILEVFCQSRLAALPHGGRGGRAAIGLLTAIPAASRLGWADLTVSAPQLFYMLADAGLISGCPNASDMPAALRLVASVCRLVTRRSSRRWTVWFSRAGDPDDPIGASIREAVTPAMLQRSLNPTRSELASRTSSISAERDQLAEELDELKEMFNTLRSEHDAVQRELTDAIDCATIAARELAEGKCERDRLAKSLETARGQHESLKRKLKEERHSASEAESCYADLDRKFRALTQEKVALERRLEDEQSQAQRRITKLGRQREDARREVSKLGAARDELERSHSDLNVEAVELRGMRDVQARAITALRGDIYRANEERSVLLKTLDGISENLEVGAFDLQRTDEFVAAVTQAFGDAKRQTRLVAALCARTLDTNTIKLFRASGTLDALRNNAELSVAQVDEYVERNMSTIFPQYLGALETIRSKMAIQGVVLPSSEVTEDDLR